MCVNKKYSKCMDPKKRPTFHPKHENVEPVTWPCVFTHAHEDSRRAIRSFLLSPMVGNLPQSPNTTL